MPVEGSYLKRLVGPSLEDTGAGQAQSSEGQLVASASLARASAFYTCCSALFISTETIHMAEHSQNLGLHEFLMVLLITVCSVALQCDYQRAFQ